MPSKSKPTLAEMLTASLAVCRLHNQVVMVLGISPKNGIVGRFGDLKSWDAVEVLWGVAYAKSERAW